MYSKTIRCLLVIIHAAFCLSASAQFSANSSRPNTVVTSSTTSGTNWSNSSNIQALDNNFATCLITLSNKPTYNLDAKNWGFQNTDTTLSNYVPSGATINGIEVKVTMRKTSTGILKDNKIMLLKAGAETGLNKARGNATWPSISTAVTYGGSTDLWGATLTGTDLLNTGFGVRVVARSQGGRDVQAEIDNISIKVYFNLTYYYSKSFGDLSSITTWGRNTDGSGANPASFTNDGQIFFLRNQTSPSLTNPLTIAGIASKLVAGDSTNALTFTVPSAYAFNGPIDISPSGNVVVSNAISPTFGIISDNTTVTFNCSFTQNVYGTTYYNLTLSGTGTKNMRGGTTDMYINNIFTVASGVTFDNQGFNITVAGNANGISNNGTITGSGVLTYALVDINTTISGTGTYSNLEINAATSNNTTKAITLNNATVITDTLILTDGELTNGSNLTMASGSKIKLADGTLGSSIGGSSGYSVIYSTFTGTSKTTANELTGTLKDFTVQSGSGTTITLNRNLTLTGNFTINSGTLDPTTTPYNFSIGGNYSNNGTVFSRNTTFTFNGSTSQSLAGSASQSFYKLAVNGTGGVVLNTPVTITNLLTLTTGIITSTSTNSLTVSSTATLSGGSSSSYVDGPLVFIVATTSSTTKVFPVGKAGAYRPATLTIVQSVSTATNYTGELFTGAPPTRTLPSGVYSVSSVRYWTISCSNAANVSSVFVKLEYGTDDNVTDPTKINILKSSGSGWINLGGLGSTAGSGFINSTSSFNTFSDFVLGNTTAPSVLPLKWMTFSGVAADRSVALTWETASETNSDRYEVERSIDGAQWKVIGTLRAQNKQQNKYEFTDVNPSTVNQYRIKELDLNGRGTYSSVVTVSMENACTFTVQPNPVTNHQFSCRLDEPSMLSSRQVQVLVVDMVGRVMISFQATPANLIPVNADRLPSGKYYVIISSGNKKIQTSVIIK
jgi:trimeric autotransporter adhesin